MNGKNRILVVDDIEMNRAMLTRIFADRYTVDTASNGKEALEWLRQHDVDIVLLDLSMPVMDGYAVIRAMRADEKLAAVPIVVTTGVADKAERKAFDLGADDFITKPYDAYIVKKRVENLIQKYVLQMENLRQALGQAEQLNQAKSAFLSRMSHDLRSPINSVISIAALLKENDTQPGQVDQYSDKITEASRYLLSVINDILDMSAIESQKIVITQSPFDLKKLIEGIASMFYGQCAEKNIAFELCLANFTEEYLFGDPLRLKEVLVNLVSNAVKFTPEGGGVTVRVCQLSRVAEMVKLRFEVADTGPGIAPDRMERIFQPFMQENDDTVQTYGGSGLGLSIAKNVVELMGGQLSVESRKGAGSTFIVELPFTVSREMPPVFSEKLRLVRALLIDDDPETQAYGRQVMSKMGIACDSATSGEAALEMMRQAFEKSQGYDICFVDWKMPGMSGIEITRAIRAAFDDDTVIVVASAYDVGEITGEARAAGADVVVPKPMFQSTVFDLLMNITGGGYGSGPVKTLWHFEGKHALVAEDNALNAEMLMELLGSAGFTAERAEDGRAACERFESSPPGTFDAILMDIQMPVMTGHEAARHIRASGHPQAKTIPMIAVTANAFTEDVRASLSAGMNDHIVKPIDTERLYATLGRLVGQTPPEQG